MKLITLHPDADAEITEAARYYESRQSGLGADLLGEVEQAFDYISTNPEASQKIEGERDGSPYGAFLTIWYMRFIQNEYES